MTDEAEAERYKRLTGDPLSLAEGADYDGIDHEFISELRDAPTYENPESIR